MRLVPILGLCAGACLWTAGALPAQRPPTPTTSPTPQVEGPDGTAMPDSVRTYVREAMTIFRARSVHRDTVDWAALEDSVLRRAESARTPAGTWQALTWALRRVDSHSFLMPPQGRLDGTPAAAVSPQARPAPPLPTARLLEGGIGVLAIPGHAGPNRAEYVDSLHAHLGALDRGISCGWIVDLRQNTGGNMWPMLAGIGPLLGAEVVGSFTEGQPGAAWRYRDGRSWLGDSAPPAVASGWGSAAPPRLAHPDAPVALLVGRKTASSGEMTLLAFLGRPGVRTFGDSTAGFTSANTGAPLRDGATLIITTSYPRDRLGRRYPLRVAPDELVLAGDGGAAEGGDVVLDRAAAWLRTEGRCTSQ